MAKIKLIDVAQQAGVSKSTVSQYLNGRFNYMSAATKARIEQAIKDLNYVPNAIARSLKTNKTNTIGVIVRDISGFYTSRAIRGIDDLCKKSGYNVIIYNTDFDAATEARSLQAMKQLRVDGVVMASSGMNNALIDEFNNSDFPIVQFQLEHENCNTSVVVSDYQQAAFAATEYLIELGHQRICFLTQSFAAIKSRNDRYQGYVAALHKHSIELDQSLIQYWERDKGFATSIKNMLEMSSAPTAIFTQHLAITTDLLVALEQLNLSIADDISVLGFDDLPMAEFFKVPITVVKQDPYKVGTLSAKLLLENIANKSAQLQKISVPCSLEVRESCRAL